MIIIPLKYERRFWSKVDRRGPDECWLFDAAPEWNGYRRMRLPGGKEAAHRIMWTLVFGDIPPDMQVLHRCDNPGCCNYLHLFLGDHATNMADKLAKDRHSRGERQPQAILTDAAVQDIRRRYKPWVVTLEDLAAEYGVNNATIWRALRGKTWRHVKEAA